MITDTSLTARSHEEDWLPVLELSIEEVFEIMVGQRVKPAGDAAGEPPGGFTAMVGIAGALCGILTISCDKKTAREIARCMLGPELTGSEEQVSDALGEVCNMIAGNFESGSAQMKSTSQATFDRIATLLRERECHIRVEGHTDNVPIHNAQFSSNWELSTSRATEIVRLLIVRDGYNPARLSAAGYAEFHPIAPNETAEGRALNRRVDIVVLRQEMPSATAQATTAGSAPDTYPRKTDRVPALKPSAAIAPNPHPAPAVSRSPNR
jgi:CheY-specific phosphatase CheX